MKQTSRLLSFLCFLLVTPACALAGLESDVRAVLRDRFLDKVTVAVNIVQLDGEAGRSVALFAQNQRTPLMPASNMKVLTSSAALELLGADFVFRTSLVQRGEDLVLIGDGDPTFGDAELLRKSGWETTTVFHQWVQQIRKAGVTSCRNVLVDDSVFDEEMSHPHWPADQLLRPYCTQIAGMTLNIGCVDFYLKPAGAGRTVQYTTDPPTRYVTVTNTCVGGSTNAIVLDRPNRANNQVVLKGTCPPSPGSTSITIQDPAMLAATVLAETLKAEGVEVKGDVGRDRTVRAGLAAKTVQPAPRLLAVHETPLTQVLIRANKESMNPYAESVCKRLGFAATGQSGSWASGTAATAGFLKKLGAAEDEFRLDDGCGLSRENRVTAAIMVRVLDHNFRGPARQQFLATLPIGGEDGTLHDRFRNGLRGRVFAKTGFIAGVSALSGYLKARDDRWYAFSILMNNLPALSNSKAKALQESIVEAVDKNTVKAR